MERTPAAEIILGTAEAWLEALTYRRVWDRHRDTERVRLAFAVLAQTKRTWPMPMELFDALPEPNTQLRIERESSIPSERSRRVQRLSELLGEHFNPAAVEEGKAA